MKEKNEIVVEMPDGTEYMWIDQPCTYPEWNSRTSVFDDPLTGWPIFRLSLTNCYGNRKSLI